MFRHSMRALLHVVLIHAAIVAPVHAQGWTFDARTIALGGAGDGNLATGLAGKQRPYKVIVVPLGVTRVLNDKDTFDPNSSSFDPILLVEDAINPLHLMFGRDVSPARAAFVNDIRNATLNRDLNAYRGFVPAAALNGEGLVDPTFGFTMRFSKPPTGGFQGIRVAAGPYIPLQSNNAFDPDLRALLASSSPVALRNTTFEITSQTRLQAGVAIAGGYRAHFPWRGDSRPRSPRDGVYVAADFDYIKGLTYADFNMAVAIDTDAAGLGHHASRLRADRIYQAVVHFREWTCHQRRRACRPQQDRSRRGRAGAREPDGLEPRGDDDLLIAQPDLGQFGLRRVSRTDTRPAANDDTCRIPVQRCLSRRWCVRARRPPTRVQWHERSRRRRVPSKTGGIAGRGQALERLLEPGRGSRLECRRKARHRRGLVHDDSEHRTPAGPRAGCVAPHHACSTGLKRSSPESPRQETAHPVLLASAVSSAPIVR